MNDLTGIKAELDAMHSASGQQEYDQLVLTRDRAQAAVAAWQQRKRELSAKLIRLLEQRVSKEAKH